jgi:hypothetical protein
MSFKGPRSPGARQTLRDRVLDKTILFSFDRSGFLRHREYFEPADLDRTMEGKVCLVTGANSGLGYEVARGLALRGAQVHLLCRSLSRGERARLRTPGPTGSSPTWRSSDTTSRPGE